MSHESGTDKVYKLNKSLYGLKESPRAWFECFNNFLTNYGFCISKYDYGLYVRKENGLTVYILLFVDDLLICYENEEVIV